MNEREFELRVKLMRESFERDRELIRIVEDSIHRIIQHFGDEMSKIVKEFRKSVNMKEKEKELPPVSYTHLTLPTN